MNDQEARRLLAAAQEMLGMTGNNAQAEPRSAHEAYLTQKLGLPPWEATASGKIYDRRRRARAQWPVSGDGE